MTALDKAKAIFVPANDRKTNIENFVKVLGCASNSASVYESQCRKAWCATNPDAPVTKRGRPAKVVVEVVAPIVSENVAKKRGRPAGSKNKANNAPVSQTIEVPVMVQKLTETPAKPSVAVPVDTTKQYRTIGRIVRTAQPAKEVPFGTWPNVDAAWCADVRKLQENIGEWLPAFLNK